MAKRKSAPAGKERGRKIDKTTDQRQQGLRAFQAGRFDSAITAWAELHRRDPEVKVALAEAYFRRALKQSASAEQLADMRQATTLCPDELRYQYHLGLALHRAGDLPAAIRQYQMVLERDSRWTGAGMALALANLQQNPQADITALPGVTPDVRTAFVPVQTLLQGEAPPLNGDKPIEQLWHGLGLIQRKDAAARETLDDSRALPAPPATNVRRYYKGVAAAQAADYATALRDWHQAHAADMRMSWLLDNLAAVWTEQLDAQLANDDLAGALGTARDALRVPMNNSALNQLLVQTLDRGAHTAAATGDWSQATELWEGARQTVSISSGLGSPRPLLHNLARAYEVQECWADAADAWRAMLRTRPRKKTKQTEEDITDAQWDWVRKRIIECYKRAGQPGEAITLFRQAIKADPEDLETRLQLVDAFVANEQEQSAVNELQRITDINPEYSEAYLRLASIYLQHRDWYNAATPLQKLITQNPQREDLRRQVAQLLLLHGINQSEVMLYDAAIKTFENGWQFAPGDYRFPLNIARLLLNQRQEQKAHTLLEQTLDLAADQPDAYIQVIDAWTIEDKLDEVQAVLKRAEANLSPTAEFYMSLGITLLMRTTPPPRLPSPFDPAPPPPPPEDEDSPWTQMAREALDRAVALKPDDPRLAGGIAAELMSLRPKLALRYAEKSAEIGPDEPNALMLLGLAQALNEQKPEAKQTLRNAARLARQQGDTAMAQEIQSLRREIDSPLFGMALQMGPFLDDFDEEGFDDFFL